MPYGNGWSDHVNLAIILALPVIAPTNIVREPITSIKQPWALLNPSSRSAPHRVCSSRCEPLIRMRFNLLGSQPANSMARPLARTVCTIVSAGSVSYRLRPGAWHGSASQSRLGWITSVCESHSPI